MTSGLLALLDICPLGFSYSLSSRYVILTQMFEGGPLFRGGALAILE